MPFRDLTEIIPPIVLPIGGKTYTLPWLGYNDAKRLDEHLDPESKAEPMSDEEYLRLMLGDAYDEMYADNVPHVALKRAAMAALADYQVGRPIAEMIWETGGDPTKVADQVQRLIGAHEPEATTGSTPKPEPRSKPKSKAA